MSYRGPKLPATLLHKVQGGRLSNQRHQQSRKDQRKAERTAKKAVPHTQSTTFKRREEISEESNEDAAPLVTKTPRSFNTVQKEKPRKHALEPEKKAPKSRAEEADDEEIAALEKKLGLHRKNSKKTGDGELDWLVFGSDGEDAEAVSKRQRPDEDEDDDDDWLRSKRRKATDIVQDESDESEGEPVSDLEAGASFSKNESVPAKDRGLDLPFENSADDFEGFDDGPDPKDSKPKKQRENPYIAPPVTNQDAPIHKYVPPSMRKAATADEEMLSRLRRQLQGLLNRLSENNILSILQSIQEVYTNNARQHVTTTLIELLKDRICDPSTLNDTFLILHAGFAAALYRVAGTDFAAQLLESLVNAFGSHHKRQDLSAGQHQTLSEGKQTLNIIAFLSNLYVLQMVSSAIIFDYLRMLLDRPNFSEANTELLLRIIRICGTQLRQDDPMALKDIVLVLQKTVSAIGESSVSVRTKFMIETIHNLKNNRMKTGLAASALSAEHMQRMKKTLGSIKSAKTTEPLRISMADIRDMDKKGKWWLIGASWRDTGKTAGTDVMTSLNDIPTAKNDTAEDSVSESDVDLEKLARAQGMNTDIRRAIFAAIAGAVDYQHAHIRVTKLNLKSKQQLEIPQILLHCVGAEPVYNHFYTLVATTFCRDHKLRKAYQFAFYDLVRRLGESDAVTGDEDDSEDKSLGLRKIYNLAKFYATLIAEGLLRLTILKPLDLANLQTKTKVFVQLLLSTVFILLRKKTTTRPKAERDAEYEKSIRELYLEVHAVPDMLSGLRFFLASVLPNSDVAANAKEAKVIKSGCKHATKALASEGASKYIPMFDDTSVEDF